MVPLRDECPVIPVVEPGGPVWKAGVALVFGPRRDIELRGGSNLRAGYNFADRFPLAAAAVAKLPALTDGEANCLRRNGEVTTAARTRAS